MLVHLVCNLLQKADPGNDFLMYREVDEDGIDLVALDEEMDFLQARPGDHLFLATRSGSVRH